MSVKVTVPDRIEILVATIQRHAIAMIVRGLRVMDLAKPDEASHPSAQPDARSVLHQPVLALAILTVPVEEKITAVPPVAHTKATNKVTMISDPDSHADSVRMAPDHKHRDHMDLRTRWDRDHPSDRRVPGMDQPSDTDRAGSSSAIRCTDLNIDHLPAQAEAARDT